MKTIHINDEDCFIRIEPDMMASVNVPKQLPDNEIPYNSKYAVALTHLLHEQNPVLDELITHKWNELIAIYKGEY